MKVSIMKEYLSTATAVLPALRIPQSLTFQDLNSLDKTLSEMLLAKNRYPLPNAGHSSPPREVDRLVAPPPSPVSFERQQPRCCL
ncbi:hypothetical protein J7T55_002364 [Diaporthe amygdali]|uniref:uncharacterized protein n=1 Tax=Phomopsis amygdali TaxID=1214568 RepID=UPI0022FF3D5D|nr:uncharacterized protein J7T55_002364 [Diaporthe amygdali]KAJ0103747.1 hypothetical protein J7T55_002364 [Diaporthe amygdali]